MVLGNHGRRLLYPMTPLQGVLTLPWSKLYKQSLFFRTMTNVFAGTLAVFGYVGYKGKLLNLNIFKGIIQDSNFLIN